MLDTLTRAEECIDNLNKIEDRKPIYDSPWTDERIELLRALWADGMSCSRIAGELGGGISRNAVIGKVHRLKLPARAIFSRSPSYERKTRTRTADDE